MTSPSSVKTTATRATAVVASLGTAVAVAASVPSSAVTTHDSTGTVICRTQHGAGPATREGAFAAAAKSAGVPNSVLKSVSYLESRWDDHAGEPSTAGGYGPMHLTDVVGPEGDGRGLGGVRQPVMSLKTVRLAAELTGLRVPTLKNDANANVCGGAAVLAYFQRAAGHPRGTGTAPSRWTDAIARYSGSGDPATAGRFVRQVFTVLHDGAARTTSDGQRVRLAAHPRVVVPRPTSKAAARRGGVRLDCPKALGCWWVPAPYEWYGKPDPYAYGNHDLANRPNDLSIDYIVVHDTEGYWNDVLNLVTDPTYVSWQYTVRSGDGQVAQHVPLDDVAWHAGNWYVNMHSIGIEHEGFAAAGGQWYTESLYESSASLVRYLTRRFDIPRDRAHIIGHDQVPGITPDYVAGMHWDPGPYWNWGHYMRLIKAPIGAASKPPAGARDPIRRGDVVTVHPGYGRSVQLVTGCQSAGVPCDAHGTNFVYLHQRPSAASPLVADVGLHPDGSPSTTDVADIGARAAAGQELVVARRRAGWLGVWWLGALAWLPDPAGEPTVVRSNALKARPVRGVTSAPVYGRAYPEASAYPAQIPYQTVTPLQYSIKRGQAYSLADASVPTDYYYAQTFNDSLPGDHTVVRGQDRYYEIWFGHRMAFVRAADVRITGR